MKTFLKGSWHYLSGLGGVGAISALVATGSVTGKAGLPLIAAIISALVGAGAATNKVTAKVTTKA